MATIDVKDAGNSTIPIEKPLAPGRAAAANSRPVVLSTEDNSKLDAIATQTTLAAVLAKIISAPATEATLEAARALLAGTIATSKVSRGTIATAQVSVGTGATQIVAARATRDQLTIVNHGTTPIYVGQSGVTSGNGVLLPGILGASLTIPTTSAVYGIAASAQTVSVLETY